jgi:hypothetical protein
VIGRGKNEYIYTHTLQLIFNSDDDDKEEEEEEEEDNCIIGRR